VRRLGARTLTPSRSILSRLLELSRMLARLSETTYMQPHNHLAELKTFSMNIKLWAEADFYVSFPNRRFIKTGRPRQPFVSDKKNEAYSK
jgi:hypothetical protein